MDKHAQEIIDILENTEVSPADMERWQQENLRDPLDLDYVQRITEALRDRGTAGTRQLEKLSRLGRREAMRR